MAQSVVELLVVIAIIGILQGMLLPAVRSPDNVAACLPLRGPESATDCANGTDVDGGRALDPMRSSPAARPPSERHHL